MKPLFKLFFLIIIIILIFRSCENEKVKALKDIEETNKLVRSFEDKYKLFKKQYDFNVDSLAIIIENRKFSQYNQLKSLKLPIIIYSYTKDSLVLSGVNYALDKSMRSFILDSIKTIIILENSQENVGTYSDNSTVGIKNKTKILFLDKNSMEEITSLTLEGGNPPQTIKKYRRNTNDNYPRYGSSVSEKEIIKAIRQVITAYSK